ncbi:CU044_2847 family protein [Streptomyces poonensis]|uniref:Trypsin-co-occurring domain-containing protein n=1 Tax=Streptomyces poonensis TaxID=68255 RepID=A0A918P7X1_9ACTN|nr:hypothetical protein GCM10010365_03860 [Streptomyces poonensis]
MGDEETRIARILMPDGTPVWARISGAGELAVPPGELSYTDVGFADRVEAHVESLQSVVTSVARSLAVPLRAVRPDEVSVEFGIELTARAGKVVGLLADGEAKGGIKVTLTWNGGPDGGPPDPAGGDGAPSGAGTPSSGDSSPDAARTGMSPGGDGVSPGAGPSRGTGSPGVARSRGPASSGAVPEPIPARPPAPMPLSGPGGPGGPGGPSGPGHSGADRPRPGTVHGGASPGASAHDGVGDPAAGSAA